MAPSRAVLATLARGAVVGMSTVTGMPSRIGVVRHALGVVAGRDGDDAGAPLRRGQGEQPVGCTPVLEGARELQVLELHDDVGAGDRRQGAGRARRACGRPGPRCVGRRRRRRRRSRVRCRPTPPPHHGPGRRPCGSASSPLGGRYATGARGVGGLHHPSRRYDADGCPADRSRSEHAGEHGDQAQRGGWRHGPSPQHGAGGERRRRHRRRALSRPGDGDPCGTCGGRGCGRSATVRRPRSWQRLQLPSRLCRRRPRPCLRLRCRPRHRSRCPPHRHRRTRRASRR